MGLDELATKPHEELAVHLASRMEAVNVLIRDRMASQTRPPHPRSHRPSG